MRAAPLSAEEVELWRLLEQQAGVESLLDFVPLRTKGYEAPRHLRPFAERLYAATTVGDQRVLCSVPPRHAKTETLLHFVAWFLLRYPQKTVAYITYAAEVAQSKSKKARDLALRSGLVLRQDSHKASEWRTPAGGGLLAYGIGGPLVGQGVDVLLVDDPIKNRAEAESPTVRQNVYDWLTSVALTRLEPHASAYVVHTRWHDDDPIGRLSADEQTHWDLISMPALDEAGRALWPSRWPAEALDARRRLVGPYDWASLYQGEPRPRGGRLFSAEPMRYTTFDIEKARLVIACDPAASEKTSSDYSAIAVLAMTGLGVDEVCYVLDVQRHQMEIPRLVGVLRQLQAYWGAPIAVEAVGGFKAVPQMLRALDPTLSITDIAPLGDKFTRALPVAAAWNDGRVRLPMQAAWLKDFQREISTFTGVKDAHDDQVDALAHGFNALHRAQETIKRGAQALRPGGFG